jgi:hypothetical protein
MLLSGRTIHQCWFDFLMRKQAVSFLLLLVLIPLVNFGPSLHRLSCFGLHGASCCNIFEGFGSHCCCDHHSTSPDKIASQRATQLLPDDSHSDCPLCRFFANYNALDPAVELDCVELRCCEISFHTPDLCVCEIVPDHARGPPAISFVA